MNKFVKLYESAIQRYTRGGFLTGDLVKFIDNAFKDDFFKKQSPNYVQKAKAFSEGGLNLRVSAVKAVRPTIHSGDVQNEADEFLIDIVQELAPGCYKEFITIPAHLLSPIDVYPNLLPVPDSLKRHNHSIVKPQEVNIKDEEELCLSPQRQTLTSDVGDKKDSEGDRKLNNFNTKIPSLPVKDEPNPSVDSGTHRYLPKKR